MRDFTDRHHAIPSSNGGLTVPENILFLKRKFHASLHCVFANRTPLEQIEFLRNLNASALSKDFNKALLKVITEYRGYNEQYAYKEGVLIPERLLESQQKYKGIK